MFKQPQPQPAIGLAPASVIEAEVRCLYLTWRRGHGVYINSPCPENRVTSTALMSSLRSFQLRTALPAVAVTLVLWHCVTCRIKSHVRNQNDLLSLIPSKAPIFTTSASQVAVPAIGPKLPGLAFISAINALFEYDSMIEEGHRKVRGHLRSGSA